MRTPTGHSHAHRFIVIARILLAVTLVKSSSPRMAIAEPIDADVEALIEASCIHCHDAQTETNLDFDRLGRDLSDPATFGRWELIFDRSRAGEMPPASEPRPDERKLETALTALKAELLEANRIARGGQRVPLRRLTRLEYAYTIQDLLGIDEAVATELAQSLPAEADTGGFDTIAANQNMSPLHVRSYLESADRALAAALQLGPRPETNQFKVNYANSQYLYYISVARGLGLGIVRQLEDAFVAYFDFGATYTFHSHDEGIRIPTAGRYRVRFEAYPYQANTPIGLKVYRGRMSGQVASLDELIGSFELVGDDSRTVELTPYLRPGDLISPSVADIDGNLASAALGDPSQGFDMSEYAGEGLALQSLSIEGPLVEVWPPASTRLLLTGVDFDDSGEIRLTRDPYQHVVEMVAEFAPRAFRRPLAVGELEAYASLARPVLEEGRSFLEAVGIPLRAILSAPPFLYQVDESVSFDDFALASRLSYFLWRSMPDAELFDAAANATLSDPTMLTTQVDRMLNDPRSGRFVRDYAGQALRLDELNDNAPDPGLYPEYDDRLGQAIARETELFLSELIARNQSVSQLIESDFTYLNRRLADHYGISGVEGQQMRRVSIPEESPRGGLLGQASIHKITANGTTTSPVPRGSFVLASLLGRPPQSPPPGIGAIEPDTRGATTIREQLDAHRTDRQCARCHSTIDPPGFALESFDPIGGFRTRYRVSGGESTFGDFTVPAPFNEGLPVDSSGVTSTGEAFDGLTEYKQILLDTELEQVARHLASQLVVFSTGAQIEFADRDAIEGIVDHTRPDGFPIRDIIHQVVRSDLFLQK